MNNTGPNDDGALAIGCESNCSDQLCNNGSANHSPNCITTASSVDCLKSINSPNDSTLNLAASSSAATASSSSSNDSIHDSRIDSKSKNRSKLEKYTAFVTSPQFTESLKSQIVINGTTTTNTSSSSSSSYLNHDAFSAQVRTIMKAAGLVENVSNRCKLKNGNPPSSSSITTAAPVASSRYPSVLQLVSPHKMTLMAELFDSEDEDEDAEIYEVDEHLSMENHDHLEIEEVDYDDEDDDDDEVEEEELHGGDGGADGDDEEDNSEVRFCTVLFTFEYFESIELFTTFNSL